MLSFRTIEPHTLELLKHLMQVPEHSEFRALRSLAYFEDAEAQFMPNMFIPTDWEAMKAAIETAVADYGSYQN